MIKNKQIKTAAFFDLDGTVLSVNSAKLWMQRERRLKKISTSQMIEGFLHLAMYKISIVDMEKTFRKALATIKGETEDRLREWIFTWFRDEVKIYIQPGARVALKEHRRLGHSLVLLTSASRYESEAAVKELQMDDFLCTDFELKDGLFTGQPVLPLCYGKNKVSYAQKFAVQNHVNLNESYFYTDSYTDLPMLKKIGHPRVVNPDIRLQMVAFKNKWPILNWRK